MDPVTRVPTTGIEYTREPVDGPVRVDDSQVDPNRILAKGLIYPNAAPTEPSFVNPDQITVAPPTLTYPTTPVKPIENPVTPYPEELIRRTEEEQTHEPIAPTVEPMKPEPTDPRKMVIPPAITIDPTLTPKPIEYPVAPYPEELIRRTEEEQTHEPIAPTVEPMKPEPTDPRKIVIPPAITIDPTLTPKPIEYPVAPYSEEPTKKTEEEQTHEPIAPTVEPMKPEPTNPQITVPITIKPPPITISQPVKPTEVPTSSTNTEPATAPKNETLTQIDQLIDKLLDDDEEISIEDLEELIAKIQTLIHQRQKKLNKEITTDFEKVRDLHLKHTINALKGPAVFYITLGSGILQLASGVSGVSPKATLTGADHLNKGIQKVTRGKVSHILDLSGVNMSDPKDVAKVVKTTSKALQGSAAMSGSVQSVADNRKHTITTEHNSKESTAKQKVQTLDQENQNTGQKADDAKRDRGSRHDRLHAAKRGIFGG